MNTIIKHIPKIIAAILILFFAVFPYNRYCSTSNSCDPIYLRNIFSKKTGLGFNVEIDAINYHELISFKLLSTKSFPTYTNKTIIAEFEVTNNYNKIVYFRPKLVIEPKSFINYLERYQCLCMEEQSVKAKETKKLKAVFTILDDIEEDPLFLEEYFDQELMDVQRSSGNFSPKNVKINFIIQNTY
ncbi:MAG: cytochrome c oxidase assembly protein [Rickettsiales bacterium]|nr:cytochrome c oxidase assembly protein [Rickettsiales bacterium]